MINLHERMLPTLAGVEPATSWSPVGQRIQLSHRGRPIFGKGDNFCDFMLAFRHTKPLLKGDYSKKERIRTFFRGPAKTILTQLSSLKCVNSSYPLKRQSQLLSFALSSACDFKSHFCKQCGPRSDCSIRLLHNVCLYAKLGLKSLQEYSADDINRRHFQMQFFLAL